MKFDLNKNPIDLFASWLDEAKITEPNDPDAMSFATVSSDGYPSVRMVLLRKFDKKGFIFLQITIAENQMKSMLTVKEHYAFIGNH